MLTSPLKGPAVSAAAAVAECVVAVDAVAAPATLET